MSRPVVLVYHRVADLRDDPLGMAVRPETFEAHLDVLEASATPVPLRHVQRARSGAVAITFDDGYADNVVVAAPALDRRGFPATFFVASDALDGPGFWWDRLHGMLEPREAPAPSVVLAVDSCRLRVDARSAPGRRRAYRALTRRLRQLPPDAIDAALLDVADQLGCEVPTRTEPTIDGDGLRSLASNPMFDVGGHTRSHALLAALDLDAQRREIAGGRRRLEDETGSRVDLFAYPYGMAGSFTAETEAIVADEGFGLACSNVAGAVPRRGRRWSLPRCAVGDWGPEEFEAKLTEWRTT